MSRFSVGWLLILAAIYYWYVTLGIVSVIGLLVWWFIVR